jgi:GNAT superfamily N-acetyltransferase
VTIRPLGRDDLPVVATLYAEFVGWDPVDTVPGLAEFFASLLLDHPFSDSEIPSLVYEDPRAGVIGVISSHVRRFTHGERAVRVACFGPLIVDPAHRRRGVATQLLERYVDGPQDMTVNDRALDEVRAIWQRLGGVTDTAASIGWAQVLAPSGFLVGAISRRLGRDKPPGAAALAKLDAVAGRRLRSARPTGTRETLTEEGLLDLMPRLETQFALRPAYEQDYLSWLFGTMELVNTGDRLVRRLVRTDDGRPLGAYVMYVTAHWTADVIQIATTEADAGTVLDHLMQDAVALGAVEVRGRFEPHLLYALRERRCRLTKLDWALLHARDAALVSTVLAGGALLTRLDGEWWMRPRRSAVS